MEERDIKKYTQDYLKHDFEKVMVSYRRKMLLEFLDKYRPKKILEIGSDMQSIFDFYTQYEKFTVVEPSDVFCEAVKKSKFYNKNVSIINDFIENQIKTLQNDNYDFIILSSLLHEVNNQEALLKNVQLLCDKKTILHINVPNSESFHLLWGYKSGLIDNIGDLTPTMIRLQQHTTFNLDSLEKFVENIGFSVQEKGSYFVKPFNHSKMSECLSQNIIDEKLLDALYCLTDYFPRNGAEIYVNCKLSGASL